MFHDFDAPVTSFEAIPDEKRFDVTEGSQTKALLKSTNESQTSELRNVEMQTDVQIVANDHNRIAGLYDAEKLGQFLKKILPKLEEELAESRDSIGKPFWKDYNGFGVEANKKSLNLKPMQLEQELSRDNIISCLAWSSNGAVLAVGFSRLLHEGWCTHESVVLVYNVDKGITREAVRTSSCIRLVQFHPYFPFVLAAGFHNGEIALWNLSEDEHVSIALEKGSFELHDDAIEHLVWKEDRRGVKLVSGGRDGKIIFWKMTLGNLTFKPEYGFIIVMKENSLRLIDGLGETLEVRSVGFWKDNENDFVVAAGNKILHCSIKAAKTPDRQVPSKSNFKDPIIKQYQAHEGLATCVSCHPSSDIFASGGIDGNIHIYRLNQVIPLYFINNDGSVRDLFWTSEACLVSWGPSSNVKSYRVDMKSMSVIRTYASQNVDENISAVAFNSKRPGKVAFGRKTAELLFMNDFNLNS